MPTVALCIRDGQRLLALFGTVALLAQRVPRLRRLRRLRGVPRPRRVRPPRQAAKPASGDPIKIGYVWGVTGAVAEIVAARFRGHQSLLGRSQQEGWHQRPPGADGRDRQQVPGTARTRGLQEGHHRRQGAPRVLASTGDTEALAQQIGTDKVVAITLSCDEKWSMPDKNPTIFTVCTTYQDQMITALKFIKDKSGGKDTKIALSYPDIPSARQSWRSAATFQESRLTLVDEQKVGAADVDAQSQALNLKKQQSHYVIIQNVTGGASAMVRSGKQVGLTSQFHGLNYAFDETDHQSDRPASGRRLHRRWTERLPGPEVGLLADMTAAAPNLSGVTMRSIQGWRSRPSSPTR